MSNVRLKLGPGQEGGKASPTARILLQAAAADAVPAARSRPVQATRLRASKKPGHAQAIPAKGIGVRCTGGDGGMGGLQSRKNLPRAGVVFPV